MKRQTDPLSPFQPACRPSGRAPMICRLAVLFMALLPFSTALAEELPPAAHELSLSDCYHLSLKHSDALRAKSEDIRAAEARYRQAIAAVFPNIHFSADQRLRNDRNSGRSNFSGTDTGGPSSNNSSSTHPFETAFTLSQPVFTGFREEILAKAVQADIDSLSYDRRRSRELLFLDVAENFHQIQLYEADLKLLARTQQVLNERVSELRHFISLGKSRESEILSANSDIADLRATQQQITGLQNASLEMLAFLTGVPAAQLSIEKKIPAVEAKPLETYLVTALNRNDLLAQAKRRESLRLQKTAAEREGWPEVSLQGSVYPYDNPDDDRDYDVVLRLDIPLYEGGAIEAKADELQANVLASSFTLSDLRRSVERDVRVAYQQFQSAVEEGRSLNALVSSTKKNYESQKKDYELGVVTNLDVLQSIRQVQDAERRLLEANVNQALNLSRLRAAAGDIP
jgi:outer membrane protein